MPGLFGIAQRTQRPDDFKRLVDRPPGHGARPFQFESLVDPDHHWALGRAHLGVLQPEQQLDSRDSVHVLFHGDLYNRDEIKGLVGGAASRASNAGQLVAELYEQLGLNFASRLDGAYCAAVVDRSRHRVVLVNDAITSYPIYWTTTSDGLVFASELRRLLGYPGVRRALNPAAVADYLTFGFPLGVKTLADGVELLPPGSTLVFDWETGNLTVSRFVNIVDAFQPWTGGRTDYLEALVDAFRRSVSRALSGDHSFGLSLSGGLDSRAVLAAADGRAHSIATYTLGVKGCADEVIADQLARIAGTRHTFFELDDRYLQAFLENLERMVELTDGMYMSHGLTELLALGFLGSADFSVLLRGHGGELAKTSLAWPLHTDERVEGFTTSQELVPYLLARANYISRNADERELFTDSWYGHIHNGAHASLEQSVAGVPLSPADLCSYLYLTEHHRRTTIASLEIFRQAVEVRLPFVDPVFLHVLFRGAPKWRQDTSIHQTLTRSGNAALLRVRNSNSGAPADAGPRAEWLLDKFNSLFKRLNVYGYRHYHNFHAWMRQQLLATVDAVLLSPESLGRGILREAGVRRLLDDTRQNRADHSYLLQTLLILELWQRQNL